MSCKVPADLTNGAESNIYNTLLEVYNGDESRAKESYSYFRTQEFLEMFGSYADALATKTIPDSMMGRLDEETFEPKLFYHEDLNQYYFIDKTGDKVFYPYDRQGLSNYFVTNEIKEFAKSLAFNYYNDHMQFDLDSLEFNNITGVTLTDFIEEFVDKVGNDLFYDGTTPEQINLGGKLLDSIDNISEWRNEVEKVFNSFKLDMVAEEEAEADHIREREEETANDLIRTESVLKDSKDNVNNNIKLYLSLLEREKTNMFGLKKFVEFGDIYTSLNKTLANIVSIEKDGVPEDLFEIYKEKIGALGETKPYFKGLYELMDSPEMTSITRNQIVSAFRLNYNNFLGSEFERTKEGVISYSVKNLSEVSSRRSALLKQWQSNFRQKYFDEDGNFNSPLHQIQQSYNNFTSIRRSIRTVEDLFERVGDEQSLMDQIVEDLKLLGITLNSEGKLSIRDVKDPQDVYRGIMFFLDNLEPSNNEEVSDKLDQIEALYDGIVRGLDRMNSEKDVNNIFTDQKVFTKLADAEAFFQEEGSDASIYTVGKTKWAYSLPSYLSEKINAWKKEPRILFDHYMTPGSPYNRGSFFMKFLLGIDSIGDVEGLSAEEWEANYYELAKERLVVVELDMFNSAQVKGDATHAKDTKSISEYDATIDYLNKLLQFRTNNKVIHKTALAADKSTEYQIHYGNAVFKSSGITRENEDGTFDFNSDVLDIMYNYFVSEYERMSLEYQNIEVFEDSEKIKNYHTGRKNALKSQLFPSFSPKFSSKGEFEGLPEDSKLHDLYDPTTGEAHLETLDGYKDVIKEKIRQVLSNNVKQVFEEFIEDGIFKTDNTGNLQNVGLDSGIFRYYTENSSNNDMAVKTVVADMLVNSVMSQVEYAKMFTGDVAYYKDTVDYKKRVPASYTDGLYANIDKAEDVYFNAAVVSSIEHPAGNIDKIAELVGEANLPADQQYITNYYRNINAADAQAWITPERWAFIKKKLGKWSSKDEILYTKMHDPKAKFTPEELKRLAQPLKGVYFDIVNGAPRYLKYSQAVLVPRLIKNTDLQRLYDKMVEKEVDELITEDGMKVGAQGITTIHDANGNLAEEFDLNVFPLTNSGWKLQQDLSPKGFKDTEIGSQIMKIIFQGLSRNGDKTFKVGDKDMKGDELIDYIHAIVSEKSNRGKDKVFSRFGVDPYSHVIQNEDKLYSAMIDDLKKRRDTPDNLLKALLAGTSPYGIPGQYQIFQNVFSSAVNKSMIKISTNGGSFIQMSDFGINKTEAQDGGIRFTPWFNEPDGRLHTPEVVEDQHGNKTIKPGGVFISGSFIAKYVPNYRELSDEQLFGTAAKNYKDGLIDHKILDTLVGYRIPNQGLPSNDSFRVMGILPEDTADTIVAYTGITTKTGSDFDIDKMYVMMPSFNPRYQSKSHKAAKSFLNKYKNKYTDKYIDEQLKESGYNLSYISKKDRKDTFIEDLLFHRWDSQFNEEVLDKHHPIKLEYAEPVSEEDIELPLHSQPEKVLNNKLIEAYSAVLTSEHAIRDIMKPIDEPMVENDIKNMYPQVQRNDMMDFDAYSDIKTKQEFKLGKAGLGQNVNALTDSVFGSMGSLSLRDTSIPKTNVNPAGDVEFDREFSQPLTTDELEDYIKSYNEFNPSEPIKLSDIEQYRQVKIDDVNKSLINGFVDIAKDPYITRGGWVTQTNNIGLLLVRAGMHPFYINAFIGQPIIKEFTRFMNNNESNVINNTDDLLEQFLLKKISEKVTATNDRIIDINNKQILMSELLKLPASPAIVGKYIKDVSKATQGWQVAAAERKLRESIEKRVREGVFGVSKFNPPAEITALEEEIFSTIIPYIEQYIDGGDIFDKSLYDMRNQIKERDFDYQLKVLKEMQRLVPLSKNLNKSSRSSKVTTDGKGKNIGSLIVMNNFIRDIIKDEVEEKPGALVGLSTKLVRNKKDTFLNTMFKNAILESYKIMRKNPKYFLTASDQVVSTFNYVSYRAFGQTLQNQDLADELEKAYQAYVMSGFKPLQMTLEEKQKLFEELPKQLIELKEDETYKDNELINALYVNQGTERQYITIPNNKKSVSYKNTLTDAWRTLFEDMPEFAEDLVKYSYAISGFNMSMNQFHDFIPYEWFNRNRFNAYMKTAISSSVSEDALPIDKTFIDQFFRHNVESSRYVKKVKERDLEAFAHDTVRYITPEGKVPQMITYEEDIDEFGSGTETVYRILIGEDAEGGYYARTTPLGNLDREGNRVVEYNSKFKGDHESATSMVHDSSDINLEERAKAISEYGDFNNPDLEGLIVKNIHLEDVMLEYIKDRDEGNEGPIVAATIFSESEKANKVEAPDLYIDDFVKAYTSSPIRNVLGEIKSIQINPFGEKDIEFELGSINNSIELNLNASNEIIDELEELDPNYEQTLRGMVWLIKEKPSEEDFDKGCPF